MAAAWALRQSGFAVTLLEARGRLGGRATSYVDSTRGETLDNCQHVSMACCTNLRQLCLNLGLQEAFRRERELYFVSPGGDITPFAAGSWPAPFHLTRAFCKLPYLSWKEKFQFARAVGSLARTRREALRGRSFYDWLKANGQSENLIRSVWEVVLVSALSESLDRIDAAYAQKVFFDGFLANAQGWQVEIPLIPLDELYSERGLEALRALGVDVRLQQRITGLAGSADRIDAFLLKDEMPVRADDFILALPHHQLPGVLEGHNALAGLREAAEAIETAPITSLHLWFDRRITELPHAIFVRQTSQWLFSRGTRITSDGIEHLYQVVISASRQLRQQTEDDVAQTVLEELSNVWPVVKEARLLHRRMITERRAVFSVTPGIDQLRPAQQTAVGNLQVAGDWTRTGWPATMEGAVRSGFLAAENVLRRHGLEHRILQPDLPVAPLARMLFRISRG